MRVDGYAAIADYAVVGDGRTAALVARDGSVDWLCVPDFDSPSVFGRVLDARRGGFFALAPVGRFSVERRYEPDTNVLETTFTTATGVARVTDAMTLAERDEIAPLRELARRIEGVAGNVELAWRFEPRFEYAARRPTIERRAGRHAAVAGRRAVALSTWNAGEERLRDDGVEGTAVVGAGDNALLAVAVADREPLVLPRRADVERRLERARSFWRAWSGRGDYDGRWAALVRRSALALKLLVFAPSAAIVAAPTTSIPESIGGTRNWDYRYSWVRDASLTLSALLRLGYDDEPRAFFWWLSHATALTHPRVEVVYRLSGGGHLDESELEHLEGYRRSPPVRIGNAAHRQVQLDVYGPMFDAVWEHAQRRGLDSADGRRLAAIADWVAEHWRTEDAGIWEVRSEPTHFTHSKAMCWVALDRASRLAAAGLVPDRRPRWDAAARRIREFVDANGWDARRGSYVRASDLRDLDASLLTLTLLGYEEPAGERARGTIAAIDDELREGSRVYRYRGGGDGVGGDEGAFLACSFWLVAALAKAGRVDDAVALMDELAASANDVGLYAEELAADGSFLGNFPQAFTHLALIDAALAVRDAEAVA